MGDGRDTVLPDVHPEVREEQHLRGRVDALRGEVAAVAAELEELRAALAAFEVRYDARIGVLIVEIDRVGLEVARYQRRVAAAQESPESLRQVEDDIARDFAAEQQRIEAEDRDASRASRRAQTLPPPPPPDIASAIKERYRRLARRFHPDVAGSDDERARNENAMKRINAAMESHDLDALALLEVALPHQESDIPGPTRGARIHWLAQEIVRLEGVLTRTLGNLAALRASSLHEMWARSEQDTTILDRLEQELRRDLTTRLMELHALRSEFERLTRRRRVSQKAATRA